MPGYDETGTDDGAVWLLYLNTDGTVNGYHLIDENDVNLTM